MLPARNNQSLDQEMNPTKKNSGPVPNITQAIKTQNKRVASIITGLSPAEVGVYNDYLIALDLRIIDNRPADKKPPDHPKHKLDFVIHLTPTSDKLLLDIIQKKITLNTEINNLLKPYMHLEKATHVTTWTPLCRPDEENPPSNSNEKPTSNATSSPAPAT